MNRPAHACLHSTDVAILAGGLGTRLREVLGNTPKVLAPIAGRAFLEYLFDWIAGYEPRSIVLCLGHQADQVLSHLRAHPRQGLTLDTVVEPEPLGTAGALRFARSALRSDPVLVINGDTFIDVDLCDFLGEHTQTGGQISLLCIEMDATGRYGRVELGSDGRVRQFLEKPSGPQGAGIINGGVYLFSAATLDRLAEFQGSSLEMDFFAKLPERTIHAAVRRGTFIDIGVPESLAEAAKVIPRVAMGAAASLSSS